MTKTAFVPGGSAPSQSQPAKPGSQPANQTPPAKTEPEKGGAPAVEDRRIAQIEAVILKVYGRFCGKERAGLDDDGEEMAGARDSYRDRKHMQMRCLVLRPYLDMPKNIYIWQKSRFRALHVGSKSPEYAHLSFRDCVRTSMRWV